MKGSHENALIFLFRINYPVARVIRISPTPDTKVFLPHLCNSIRKDGEELSMLTQLRHIKEPFCSSWHIRISLTPACNLNCIYCNPLSLRQRDGPLGLDFFGRVLQAAFANGIYRVHWTGGEPGIVDLESMTSLAKTIGFNEQIVTTNGTLLADRINGLIERGLTRLNVSIDSLDIKTYKIMTGRNGLDEALQVLRHSVDRSLACPKINIVVTKYNFQELRDFIDLARKINSGKSHQARVVLKLIELCPNNPAFSEKNRLKELRKMRVTRYEMLEALNTIGELQRTSVIGDNPNCDYFMVGTTDVAVGLVTMPSLAYPCGGSRCRKLRISPYGLMGACITRPDVQAGNQTVEQLIKSIRNLMNWRQEKDLDAHKRKHLQTKYGLWRFGECTRADLGSPHIV